MGDSVYTRDTVFNGAVTVWQERAGYRFSIDALLLAGHVMLKPGDRLVDLGTGCGILPLILAHIHTEAAFFGIELQKRLADLSLQNIAYNKMDDRIRILHSDLKSVRPEMTDGYVDVVVSNPPYRRLHSGKINPNPQKAVARHEVAATLNDIIQASGRILKESGRLYMIYPAIRATDLIFSMRSGGIEPKWIRMVHSFRNEPAKMVIAKGLKWAGPDMEIASPLYIYEDDGRYSEEVRRIFGDDD
ncbi:MAG: methyltransferase [Desulfobacterales bacterium]